MINRKKVSRDGTDLETIRNEIVLSLYNYLNVPVIPLNTAVSKPGYPFIGYKFIVPYNTSGQGTVTKLEAVSGDEAGYINEVAYQQPQMTLSITAYSLNELESSVLAQKAHDFFKHVGYYDLERVNCAVVSSHGFGSRDTLIEDDYERRVGFDVIIRTADRVTRKLETIEQYNIDKIQEV